MISPKIIPYPHVKEMYRCDECNKKFKYLEVYKDWQCPICHMPISIGFEVDGQLYCCNRLKVSNLKIGDDVTFNNNIHKILAISKSDSTYRIALQKYKAIDLDKDDLLLVILGSW